MSGVLDFLFEGQPPPSVTTYGQTITNVPQWYSDYTQGILSRANQIAAQPYTPSPVPKVAGLTPQQQQAMGIVGGIQGQYQGLTSQGASWLQQAADSNGASGASPYLNDASGYLSQSTAPGASGLDAASPYLSAASGKFTDPGVADSYMNPYISNVIDRAGTLAGRQWNEQILPSLQNTFAGAGQYGSSKMREVADRGARDMAEGLQGQAQAALSQGYSEAGNLFNQDQSRLGQLGATAGTLGSQQQQALQQAAATSGNLGNIYGNLAGQDAQTKLQAGQASGNLAQLIQSLGLQGASALGQTGAIQQNQNQANLDSANQDFQNQLNYPKGQLDWLSNILHGQTIPQSTQTQQQGPLAGSSYQPSGVSQIGAAAGTLSNLWDLYSNWGG